MNTNTLKISFVAFLAHLMCLTVILAHLHAKDAVSVVNQQSIAKISGGDLTAKAMGDLHHHIDKTSLKIQSGENAVQARVRDLQPLLGAEFVPTLRDYIADFLLRFHFAFSLMLRALAV